MNAAIFRFFFYFNT
ncbi:pheST operon leader peptide PheM [Escherichia coli]|nr:pheST operon leader peptide PheM [Klebsiella pneumoniae]EFF2273838.1 pheST operon leader peptide PheM [Escherichia coli]EFQ7756041.1 pheST operon leader peptide PheM [Salmonella enterica]EKK2833106.1 pheST operon leader peptide PheM [Escherichia coli O33]HCK6543032.1 pheST operon leader peptide PheM [Salmonella enterica subsp. enterica serovar Typhi str. CT18]EGB5196654.1 pheST operon leader peptide PheM [Salmonella enterica]